MIFGYCFMPSYATFIVNSISLFISLEAKGHASMSASLGFLPSFAVAYNNQ